MSPASRPAETGGAAAAVAVLVAHLLGMNDPTVISALAVVVGFVPAAITFLVHLFKKPAAAVKKSPKRSTR